MLNYEIYTSLNPLGSFEKQDLVDFIFQNYEEFGHSKKGIKRAIDYAQKDNYNIHPSFSHGGLVVVAKKDQEIVGALVINKTGFEDILPANMIMYITTHQLHRRQGIARSMVEQARRFTNGNIATHVLPNNTSQAFFSQTGFNSKVLEMMLS